MAQGVLVITVGLPGSGKSTLCKNILDNCTITELWDIYHVSYDAIVNDRNDWLLPDFHWKTERANVMKCVEKTIINFLLHLPERSEANADNDDDDILDEKVWLKFVNSFSDSAKATLFSTSLSSTDKIRRNFVFLMDDNMYYRSMRYGYYQLARKYRLGFVQIYITCSPKTAFKRNSSRPHCDRVTDDVIGRMVDRLEPPNAGLDDWEKNYLVFSNDSTDTVDLVSFYSTFLQMLSKSLNDLPPILVDTEAVLQYKAQSRLETKESRLHQADLIMRRIVSDICKSRLSKGDDLKTLCTNLNKAKNYIIGKVRSNILDNSILENPAELENLLKEYGRV